MPGDHRSCRSELKKCSPIHEYLRDLYYLILSGAREAFRAWHSSRLVVFVPGGRGTHQLATLDESKKEDKRKMTALQKDKQALQARIAHTDALLASIGGQLAEADTKMLILTKLYDLANEQLERYLNAEKRVLVQAVENFWDKYAVSSRAQEATRLQTLGLLDQFLKGLSYVC